MDKSVPERDFGFRQQSGNDPPGVLIEAKDLVNGVSMVQIERVEKVEYVHVALDCHDIIIAAGALSQSFIDDDSFYVVTTSHQKGTAGERPCRPRLMGQPEGAFGTSLIL